MVNLVLIEKAIRAVFTITKHKGFKFSGSVGDDDGLDFARLCIVALCHLHGIAEKEACLIIGISEDKRAMLIKKFNKHQDALIHARRNKRDLPPKSKRLMTKFALCENYIKLHREPEFISTKNFL